MQSVYNKENAQFTIQQNVPSILSVSNILWFNNWVGKKYSVISQTVINYYQLPRLIPKMSSTHFLLLKVSSQLVNLPLTSAVCLLFPVQVSTHLLYHETKFED